MAGSARTQTLYGYVYEQNSGRKPVKGVMVKSTFANQVSTDDKGGYTLQFQNGKPGAAVLLYAEKQNWVITDKERLKVNLPDDPYKQPPVIILCRQDLWNKMNAENRALIEKTIATQYESKLAALDKKAKDFSARADSLWQQYTKMQEELSKYAEALSSTNLDEVSEVERRAYALFKEGKLEECLKLRASLKSEENLKKAVDEKQQMEKAIANKDSVIALHKRNLKEEARIAQLKYDWITAEQKLAAIATIDTMDWDARFEYAYLFQQQNEFSKAQAEYEKLLITCKHFLRISPFVSESYVASINNNLGVIFWCKHDFLSAEKAFFEALKILNSLAQSTPGIYESDIAITQNNLALLYKDNNDYMSAEKAFLEALKIYKTLATGNPVLYNPFVATVKNNIGVLYMAENKYDESQKIYLQVLEIYEQLASAMPIIYEPYVAITKNNLGILYSDKNDYFAAEQAYLEALKIYRQLVRNNPARYDPDIATLQNNLGNLYRNKKDYIAAVKAFLESLEIRKRLAISNPATYEAYVAESQNNLGVSYYEQNDYINAETAYRSALEIRKKIAVENQSLSDPNIAEVQNNLGILYSAKKSFDTAENAYLAALEINTSLAKKNAEVYDPSLARVQNNLGLLYVEKNDYAASERATLEALSIYKRFAIINPEMYDPYLAITLNNLGVLYVNKKDFAAAEKACMDALEIRKKLFLNNPSLYKQNFLTSIQMLFFVYYTQLTDSTKGNSEKILLQQKILARRQAMVFDEKIVESTIDIGKSYGSLAWYLLLNKEYTQAEIAAKRALFPDFNKTDGYDNEMEWVNTNLALSLLLQGKYAEAEKIYLLFKDKPYKKATYKKAFLADLDEMEKNGITHKDFEKIRKLLAN